MSTIKGIIVGTGKAGTELHFGALKANGAEIVAFVDVNEELGSKAAKRLGVPHFYTSLEEALAIHSPHFVSICTTVQTHAMLAEIALKAGVNVLLEKPMTSTLEEAKHLAQIMKTTGKTVTVVHNHKFYPGIQAAKKKIDSGEIGEVLHIHREMTFLHEQVRMMEEGHWAHAIPGGRLFEANPHNLYLLYNFIGPFALSSIAGRKVSKLWPHARIDEFLATGKTKNSTVTIKMSLNASNSSDYGKDYLPIFLVIVGSKKTLIVTYHEVRTIGEATMNKLIYKKLPAFLMNTLRTRFLRRPKVLDAAGKEVSIGIGSGHFFYMKEYLSYLRGESANPPVLWEEAYFVEEMNEEMGYMIEKSLK